MQISSQFDSGNIHVVSATSPNDIRLRINRDNQSNFYQWFHFRLHTQAMVNHTIVIEDLAKSAYPKGWEGYQALASYDRDEWFRVDTSFYGDELTIDVTPEYEVIYFAYFIPYSYERYLNLLASAQTAFDCQHVLLGDTIDGRDVSMLVIGDTLSDTPKKSVWITARQHPGESMASWCVEGLIYRLLDEDDGVARKLLKDAVFYIVPNMNPDGSVRGHLRTNAVGTNLNREWQTPSLDKSPEVYYVLNKMRETGVDMYLDIHGDEALPYNFVAGSEGVPNYDDTMAHLENTFKQALLSATPEFQDTFGYPKDEPGKANLTVASNAIAHQFGCMSYTLEMPFKDNADLPDAAYGWSVPRCAQLGEDLLIPIRAVIQELQNNKTTTIKQ
ncbi:M14-type cytosolic carboxypeptidase [Glaciecola sp. HTCC2999]|uniref:M14 family metallopeptidase n=1 Tax=Glaciecola sp. HTCC2999 TaxID=455436 RepID=UPI0000E0E997|nr:M14-type cytosolic carboxypeptidase [Glaciecola sp. HTCC2999]